MGIDVFGGLPGRSRVRRSSSGKSGRVVVEFKAPNLVFSPDKRHIARTLATAMARTFREYMLSGRWIDGRPLPPVAPATVIRRQYRLVQLGRGAAPLVSSRRVLRKDTRERKRLERRYASRSVGTSYPTAELSGKGLLGLESGTMANFTVRPGGGGFQLYVPEVRGRIDRRGVSPWLLLVQRMGGVGRMDNLLSTPRLTAARAQAWWSCFLLDGARMLDSRDFRRGVRSLKRLGSELAETAQQIGQTADRIEAIADSDGG